MRPSERNITTKCTQSGGQTVHGPENWFTGDVLIDFVRNAKGQTLYVTDQEYGQTADSIN